MFNLRGMKPAPCLAPCRGASRMRTLTAESSWPSPGPARVRAEGARVPGRAGRSHCLCPVPSVHHPCLGRPLPSPQLQAQPGAPDLLPGLARVPGWPPSCTLSFSPSAAGPVPAWSAPSAGARAVLGTPRSGPPSDLPGLQHRPAPTPGGSQPAPLHLGSGHLTPLWGEGPWWIPPGLPAVLAWRSHCPLTPPAESSPQGEGSVGVSSELITPTLSLGYK